MIPVSIDDMFISPTSWGFPYNEYSKERFASNYYSVHVPLIIDKEQVGIPRVLYIRYDNRYYYGHPLSKNYANNTVCRLRLMQKKWNLN